MTKAWKITISIIASILVLIMGFLAVYYLWPWNKEFFDNAKKEWEIPGLETTFTPQGFSKIEGQNKYLISGYMNDESPSRVYVIDGETGTAERYFTLSYTDEKGRDKDYKGHAGGIVSYGSSVWVVGDGNYYRFTLTDIENVDNGKKVYVKAWNNLENNNADFVFAHNGKLYIGEFYKEGDYETYDGNHLTTRSGEQNKAIVYGFDIDERQKSGLKDEIPDAALSIRGLCQGIAITAEGKFILSTSYGIADSNIYLYDNVFSGEKHSEYRYGLYNVPLWYLDNQALISTTNAPSMTEEIVVDNGNLYILFESAAKKYKLFNRKRLTNVYSLSVSSL